MTTKRRTVKPPDAVTTEYALRVESATLTVRRAGTELDGMNRPEHVVATLIQLRDETVRVIEERTLR